MKFIFGLVVATQMAIAGLLAAPYFAAPKPTVTINGLKVPCTAYSTRPGHSVWVCVRAE
jgi:hypothetical protein